MLQRITVKTYFAIFLTVTSTINAHSLPETRKVLGYKPVDTEQFSHENHSRIAKDNLEGSQNGWDIPLPTRKNRGSSQFQRPGVPFMTSTFETRTEVLPLKDRNFVRYHLSETSLPYLQSPRTVAYEKQNKANTLSYSLPSSVDSRLVSKDNKLDKSSNEVVISTSSPPTGTIFKDYQHPNFYPLASTKFSTDGQHEDALDLFGLSYLSAQEAQGLLSYDTELQGLLNGDTKTQGLTSHSRYQSDSSDSQRPFPRFSIPLHSLQLDLEQSKDYNTETSEIIEPTFIVPRDTPRHLEPRPISPTITYGVSISDGMFSRKEIRKDNGEFFSRSVCLSCLYTTCLCLFLVFKSFQSFGPSQINYTNLYS